MYLLKPGLLRIFSKDPVFVGTDRFEGSASFSGTNLCHLPKKDAFKSPMLCESLINIIAYIKNAFKHTFKI